MQPDPGSGPGPDLRALIRSLGYGPHPLQPEGLARLMAALPLALVAPATERAVARKQGAVVVIPVTGVITAKPGLFERYGLGSSAQTLGRELRAAVQDDEVKAVVLDVDSPGGTVAGVPELAAEIRAARGSKPIVAQANFTMASAAYWLGAQADEIVASPSAEVGSIGVYILHWDDSKFWEEMGMAPTLISAGKYKTEGNPFEPLGEEARAHLQDKVDAVMALFVGDVAKGRGVSPATVREGYGEGRVLDAGPAKAAGMVDKIRTLEDTLRAYGVASSQPRPANAVRRGRALMRMQLDQAQLD